MGFFKEFKEDLSQAVNELLPNESEGREENAEQLVNTMDTEEIASDEVSDSEKMKEWLEEFTQEKTDDTEDMGETVSEAAFDTLSEDNEEASQDDEVLDELNVATLDYEEEEGENMDDNVDMELLEALNSEEETEKNTEAKEMDAPKLRAASTANDDEVTVITKGTTINGSISCDCSLEINGTITGDVECLGKLSITGKIVGNSSAAEVYVNTERLDGSITSEGSVKIGLGTVVVGDIVATSGVIAGAVKGEIDINGPIVIDSTAIIKGNIKAKSVQINNGAVIEGFCSLSYSAVDVDNIFE
jgi:cytoskeletal protein CcmA (bactofilin family)